MRVNSLLTCHFLSFSLHVGNFETFFFSTTPRRISMTGVNKGGERYRKRYDGGEESEESSISKSIHGEALCNGLSL